LVIDYLQVFNILETETNILKKIRNTAKFMISNINDIEENLVPYDQLQNVSVMFMILTLQIDKYILYRLVQFTKDITEQYEAYQFYKGNLAFHIF
jgi:isoleucyl-tRNA synthetase